MNLAEVAAAGRVSNSSPQTKMSPVLRVQQGCTHTINIPVEDADGDDVRCRWSELSLKECGGVCGSSYDAVLDSHACRITYTAPRRTGYFAVALQVEDFADSQSTVAMSSVPLQFMIYQFSSTEGCGVKPQFDDDTPEDGACIAIPSGTTYQTTLTAYTTSTKTNVSSITTQSPPGMTKGELQMAAQPTHRYVDVTWTPTEEQHGPNIFCFLATDKLQRASDQRCITLLAGVSAPTMVSSTTTANKDTTQLEVVFDQAIRRPDQPSYVRFLDPDTGTEILTIDTSIPANAEFPEDDSNESGDADDDQSDRTLLINIDVAVFQRDRALRGHP